MSRPTQRPQRAATLLATSLALLHVMADCATADAREKPEIPAPLQPWAGWVMHAHKDLACTPVGDGRACDWPGALQLEVSGKGGRFTLHIWRDRPGLVALPGDPSIWPQDVASAGQPLVVVHAPLDRPMVQLGAGHHEVTGTLPWAQPPEVIPVPTEVGVVALRRDGKTQAPPRREGNQVWLRSDAREADDNDALRVEVHRQLRDGVPLRLTTQLVLKVSGRARDVHFGRVLVKGAVPVALQSPLPLQVGSDGHARARVRAGSHVLRIDAVMPRDLRELPVPTVAHVRSPETWVWQPDPSIRAVKATGLSTIDPQQTSLPPQWRKGTAFIAPAGAALKLEQLRRGEEAPPPNRLTLSRSLWLDIDGGTFTARDQVRGRIRRGWRLDYTGAGELGRVSVDQHDQLITASPGGGKPGVELRQGRAQITADLRIPATSALPAVGWDFDPRTLSTTLHLPPGWRLLGATGVDRAPGTWLGSWTLFDFFLLLMVALAAGRLLGWLWAVVALLAMLACHGEADAPRWIWLHVLAAIALVRVLPWGFVAKLAWVYRAGATLWLVLALVPFSIEQVRGGIYPQVAASHGGGSFANTAQRAAEAPEELADASMKYEAKDVAGRGRYAASPKRKKQLASKSANWASQRLQQVDPNAVVQTGPGLPDWSWRSWHLSWSGPVQRDQQLSLILLTPGQNLALALLRVLLLAALAIAVLEWRKARASLRRWVPTMGGATTALIAAIATSLLAPSVAEARSPPKPVQAANVQQADNVAAIANALSNLPQAQVARVPGLVDAPGAALLKQLEQRLVAAAACKGRCAMCPRMRLSIRGGQLRVTAEVHAQTVAAWTLSGPASSVPVAEVRVDGKPTTQLRRGSDGMLSVRMPAGRHEVELVAQLPQRSVITVQFSEQSKPHRIELDTDGWHVDGVGASAVPDATLQLSRAGAAAAPDNATATDAPSELPPWYSVERTVVLGLPWTARTSVSRAFSDRAALVKIPLLPGETVLSAAARVEQGPAGKVAVVQLPRGRSGVVFESELAERDALTLSAAEDAPWTERWHLRCTPIFHCRAKGIAPAATTDDDGSHAFHWAPWPGESATIQVQRPAGVKGQAITIDRVDYEVRPGNRLLEATLSLSARASQGGFRTLSLPEGAAVQRVTVDGKERAIRPDGRKLALPVRPGKQKLQVRWQQPWSRKLTERVPAVDLGGPAANARITIARGEDRWLLLAMGPSWGPAVLFWSHVLVLALLALGLSRLPGLPLKGYQWLLLSLGFAQVPIAVLFLVVAWFAALRWRQVFWRERNRPGHAVWFDLSQLAIAGWTVVALAGLYGAIHSNLLLDVDMQVIGAGSSNERLTWYVDRVSGPMPTPAMLSLPLLVWRLAMLAWSLWLVWSLLQWLPWAWRSFSDGGLWRSTRAIKAPAGGPIPPPPGEVADISGASNATDPPPEE